MESTRYNLTISTKDTPSKSASVSTDDAGDVMRLMQLAGQGGDKRYNASVTTGGLNTADAASMSLTSCDPDDVMRLLQLAGVPYSSSPKACGCPQDCDCEGPTCDAPGVEMYEGIDKDYPDTAEGAIQALGDMSTHNVQGATATPDPQVDRVWLVKHSGGQSIVYLKKPGDSYSHHQPMNDFEDIDDGVGEIGMQVEEEAEFDWGARDWKHDQHVVSMKRATKQGTAQKPDIVVMEQQAEYDYGHKDPTEETEEFDIKDYNFKGRADLPERLTNARFGSNALKSEMRESLHTRLVAAYKAYIKESEHRENADGRASPLTATKRDEFLKDPYTTEPDTDGSESPLTDIKRQHINR